MEIDSFNNFYNFAFQSFKDNKSVDDIPYLYENSLDIMHRKTNGIYYTPKYIVDYIVKNTIEEQIKDKDLDFIFKFKIVDPACGCGVFLLSAFECILNRIKQIKGYIDINDKIKVIENNLFGVDLDKNAVDITKLLLTFKVYENERHML